MKGGIIGFGYMGHYHLNKAKEIGLPIAAAYDIDPSKREDAERLGLRFDASLSDFLSDPEIKLVFICTPNDVHASLAIAALEAGKHVLCEKPVTMNAQELEEVLAVARRKDLLFTVHQNRRWDVDFRAVQQVIAGGDIGTPTTVLSRVYGQRGVCFGWRADPKAGGGMLYDWGVHLIDQYLQMFRGHQVVSVYARLQSILTPAVDDSFELEMIFDHEVCAKVQVGTFALQPLPRWFVYGDRGTMMLEDFTGEKGGISRIRRNVSGFDSVFGKHNIGPSRTMAPLHPEEVEVLPLPEVKPEPLAFHQNLVAACEKKEAAYVTPEDMLRTIRIVDLAFESSRLRQVIKTSI